LDELVAIAKILKPRGLRGEVVAAVLTDFPERFDGLVNVTAVLADGGRRELKIEKAWFQKDRIILRFQGIGSIEDAEELRNAEVCVDEADAVELDEGEYFDWQLQGCDVETVDGETIGKVRELLRTGAAEILVVDGKEREYFDPLCGGDLRPGRYRERQDLVDPPEGLF